MTAARAKDLHRLYYGELPEYMALKGWGRRELEVEDDPEVLQTDLGPVLVCD